MIQEVTQEELIKTFEKYMKFLIRFFNPNYSRGLHCDVGIA